MMEPKDWAALAIGVAGTATAIAALYRGWSKDREERGRFKVHCFLGYIDKDGTSAPLSAHGPGPIKLIWDVTNIGLRSLVLNQVGLTVLPKNGSPPYLAKRNGWPKKLEHGERMNGYDTEWPGYVSKIDTIFATDTVGGMYEAPDEDIERIKADARDLAQNKH